MLGSSFLRSLARNKEDKALARAVVHLCGFRPKNISLYRLALRHSSLIGTSSAVPFQEHNERLEYLGDAILGAIVAEYLFKRYPYKDEGFLTEFRSRIVNREALNDLGVKIGLHHLIASNTSKQRGFHAARSMTGDALEAFIGALYLDLGFHKCRQFVIAKLISTHINLDELQASEGNAKSRLLEWAQRERLSARFEVTGQEGDDHRREFVITVFINNEARATGRGLSKKKAEQAAAAELLKSIKEG